MSDLYILGVIAVAVASLAVALYVWDRNTKGEQIEWADAVKLAMGAGSVASGVAYAVGTDGAEAAVETVTSAAQDMFVGKPGF
jgi:hypothetical protein